MKKLLFLESFIFICFKLSYGQGITPDSLTAGSPEKVRYGFYFIATVSANFGEKTFPHYYDSDGCNCYFSYDDFKESKNTGYNLGFEVESKKIAKKISISSGINFELFHYTGTVMVTHYDGHSSVPPDVYGPYHGEYYYRDLYFTIPVSVHYYLLNSGKRKLNFYAGAAGGFFLSEKNSDGSPYNEYNAYPGGSGLTTFAMGGIDFFYGKRTVLNIGLRFTSQLNTTPTGRRLASAGIKVGIFF